MSICSTEKKRNPLSQCRRQVSIALQTRIKDSSNPFPFHPTQEKKLNKKTHRRRKKQEKIAKRPDIIYSSL